MKKIFLHLFVLFSLGAMAEEGDSVCPVKLISFKVVETQNFASVQLQWATASEINNEKFIIERAVETQNFASLQWSKIGEVQGHGNSDEIIIYGFIDNSPIYQTTYYRLKQIDYDGAFEYSPIVSCKPLNLQTIIPYPNPCNNVVTINGECIDISNLSYGINFITITDKNYKIFKQ